MSGFAHKISYILTCDDLRLSVEFSLSPNVFGRIGSSPDMEISLPLVGLADEECRLSMDKSNLIWLIRSGETTPIRIDAPSYFHAGPYRFLLREVSSSLDEGQKRGAAVRKFDISSWRQVVESTKSKVITAVCGCFFLLWAGFSLAGGSGNKRENPGRSNVVEVIEEYSLPISQVTESKPVEKISSDEVVSKKTAALVIGEPERMDLEALASTVAPCVFLINVSDETDEVIGTGTGFSVSPDGLIATNHHVIEKGLTFSVMTNHGARYEQVRVVVEDADADLALLKIDGRSIPYLQLADTSDVAVGKRVAVYGSPEGLSGTLSEGMISAPIGNLSSKLPEEELPNKGRLIQTTAAISPGSSGSPIFDGEGKVLGVMTLNLRGSGISQSLNFAVPVEALKLLLEKPKEEWLAIGRRIPPLKVNIPQMDSSPDRKLTSDPALAKLSKKMDLEDWVVSMKIASELLEKYPTSSYLHFQHGYSASMLRLDQQSEASYRKVVEINPTDHIAWNNLGVVIRAQNRYPESLVALEKCVSIMPDFAMGWDNVMMTNVMLGNWAKARSALQTISNLDPDQAIKSAESISKFRLTDLGFKSAVMSILSQRELEVATVGPPMCRVLGVPSGDFLTIRSGPGSSFSKVSSIANGTNVFVTGKTKKNGETTWVPIEHGHISGWVTSKFLTVIK
ncbi:trypsin-like peptidase domain-containing protein [Luteolibacter sp. AS25]|uniref:trypsin-like peptidase domain-containing protein n=1 Tax=Luteolibacter sp. AS25 TaxID=3135776 RepID=UPI00398B6ED1